jgi:branched-chain amino acid transport system permease protein
LNISALLDCFTSVSGFASQITTSIVIAMILFLVASGLSLIFGVLNISNFAHGSLYMIGVYLTYTVVSTLGSFWVALIVAPLGAGLIGFIIERVLIRRIYDAPHLYQFLLTFGVLLVLDDLARMVWGFTSKSIATPEIFQGPPMFVLGSPIPRYLPFHYWDGSFNRVGTLVHAIENKNRQTYQCSRL